MALPPYQSESADAIIESWSTSVSTVYHHRLDNQVTGIRFPGEAKNFYSRLCVQTSSRPATASCPMGTRGPFPRDKVRLGRDADHSPPFSAEVMNEYSYTSSPS
jgi:hypothetical protein